MPIKELQAREMYLSEADNLVSSYFLDKDGQPLRLVSYQSEFVNDILKREHDRFVFVAATQSGKSEAIACAIAMLAIYYPNERIINISYTDEQARIIYDRVKSHLVNDSDYVRSLVDMRRSMGLSKEFSRKRMFMRNGTEIRIMSTGTGETEKTGESLLGFEGTVVIVDEAGSIPDKVFLTKILRMLGAQRSKGFPKMLILSGTPHNPGYFEDAFNDERYKRFHVDWKKAVECGRMSLKLIEEQKEKMTAIEFECWYEARFPSMTEDSMFDMREIERNIVAEDPQFYGTKILSVDVARFGIDKTVYTMLDYCNDVYRVVDTIADDQKSTMQVAGKIIALNNVHHFDRINVDEAGVGGGPLDRLREQGIEATGVIAGSQCTNKEAEKTCLNLKAELYATAKRRFEQNTLKITGRQELKYQLRQIKRDYQSNGKLKIIDPDKSPDFADSLVYGLYNPSRGTFIVLDRNKGNDEGLPWGR